MAKFTSVVETEAAAQRARSSGKYISVGVYKKMPPDNRIFLSAQSRDTNEWIEIFDDEKL